VTQGAAVRISQFLRAKEHAERLRHYGKHEMVTMMSCPPKFSLGARAEAQMAPYYAGNTCEPWMARFTIVMLDQLLDTGKRLGELFKRHCWRTHCRCRPAFTAASQVSRLQGTTAKYAAPPRKVFFYQNLLG